MTRVSKAAFFEMLKQGKSVTAAARQLGITRDVGRFWAKQRRIEKKCERLVIPRIVACSKTELLQVTMPYVLHPDSPSAQFEAWFRFFVREFGMERT